MLKGSTDKVSEQEPSFQTTNLASPALELSGSISNTSSSQHLATSNDASFGCANSSSTDSENNECAYRFVDQYIFRDYPTFPELQTNAKSFKKVVGDWLCEDENALQQKLEDILARILGAVAEKVGAAGKIFHIFLSLIFFLKKAKLATYYEQWGKIFHFKHPMQQQHFESLAIYDEYKAKNDPKGEFYFPAQHIILSCPAGKKAGFGHGTPTERYMAPIWNAASEGIL